MSERLEDLRLFLLINERVTSNDFERIFDIAFPNDVSIFGYIFHLPDDAVGLVETALANSESTSDPALLAALDNLHLPYSIEEFLKCIIYSPHYNGVEIAGLIQFLCNRGYS